MIEKMKFLRITGPKDDIDRVNEKYLLKHEIHLENAMSELSDVPYIKPFVEMNPNKEYLTKAENLISMLGNTEKEESSHMEIEEAIRISVEASGKVGQLMKEREELENQKKHLEKLHDEIEPYRLLDYDINKILEFKFIRFRFGRISHEYYQKFAKYGYENLNTLFEECDRDDKYVWGVYFVPVSASEGIDAIYSSLHFEQLYIANEYEGVPEDAYKQLLAKIEEKENEISRLDEKIQKQLAKKRRDIISAYQTLKRYSENFDIRKMAACTKERIHEDVFYILCGWMNKTDTKNFLKETEDDPNVFCLVDEGLEELESIPPTKLKNPKILKPFELFVRMYGLPAYTEMDPTLFIALTYTVIFGIMFGDVGQGAVLVIAGFLVYKVKHMALAGIISIAGIWSVFFGFMYGSLFGSEEILPALWMRPMEDIMSTLMLSVVFGAGLILVAMILHIINAIKERNIGSLLFDPSGISGLICYGTVVAVVLFVMNGNPMPGVILLSVLVGLPLVSIIFKEPLCRLLQRKRALEKGESVAMYLIEAIVEGFDVVLSYATNTISFVRVGAFALSHAGMMGVVFSLAGATKGEPNLIVLILGNLVVMGLEGLVVGIQVLRLEYYEMFSRFYKGSGKEFKPFHSD